MQGAPPEARGRRPGPHQRELHHGLGEGEGRARQSKASRADLAEANLRTQTRPKSDSPPHSVRQHPLIRSATPFLSVTPLTPPTIPSRKRSDAPPPRVFPNGERSDALRLSPDGERSDALTSTIGEPRSEVRGRSPPAGGLGARPPEDIAKEACLRTPQTGLKHLCSPEGIRTLATALRGRRPRPLDDGALELQPGEPYQIRLRVPNRPGLFSSLYFFSASSESLPLSRSSKAAGVPGLEPRLTEPESVVLPITPYPIGFHDRLRCPGGVPKALVAAGRNTRPRAHQK